MATEIPQIRIYLASEEPEAPVEPPSPYAWANFETATKDSGEEDGLRSHYLSPPPALSPRFIRQLSPLGPPSRSVSPPKGQGLEKSQFQALLRSSREKNKPQDLRREVAIKVHQSKQLERRALFLSKVAQPPSPSATSVPITPPESPSIFHYSLPSPGLVSPLAYFESISADPEPPVKAERKKWVEQVDYRLPSFLRHGKQVRRHSGIPSLEEISARLNAQRERERAQQILFPSVEGTEDKIQQSRPLVQSTRLPAFLQQSRQLSTQIKSDMPATTTRQRLSIGNVGRLHMPIRSVEAAPTCVTSATKHEPPKTPNPPELRVTTTVVPFSTSPSPIALSEYNLKAMNSREKCSADMLSRLKRRSAVVATAPDLSAKLKPDGGINGAAEPVVYHGSLGRAARWKRHSAPADFRPLGGSNHPVLSMPGGF